MKKYERNSKSPVILIFAAIAIFAAGAPSYGQGFTGFDINQASQYLRYLPPIIKSVSQDPENPEKGDTVKVTANVSRLHFGNEDYETIESVMLYYTVDGQKWEEVAMDEGEDKLSWTGEIPAVDTCTEVDYHLTAKDSAGNITMELPGWLALPGWNPPKPGETPADPHDFLPKIYDHVTGDRSLIPTDMQMTEVPPYMDVKTVWFGYDDNNFYFRILFGAPVQQGTLNPVDANLYLMAVINCSLDAVLGKLMEKGLSTGFKNFDMNDPELKEMAQYFWAWYYGPLLDVVPPLPGIGKIPGVGLIHFNPSDMKIPIFETKGFSYNLHDNYMDVTLDRKVIGPSGQNMMTFVTGNVKASGADFTSIKPLVGDISYSTTIIMDDHGYDVCAEGE